MSTSADNPRDLPTVLATLPRCPRCGAADRQLHIDGTYRPIPEADGKVQYADCRLCGTRFKIDWA